MNVKELRELLSEVPEGFTQQEFDELQVSYSVDGMNFESPCPCETGIVTFGGICNEEGDEILSDEQPENISMFILMPHGITEKLEQEGQIQIDPILN